MSKVAKIKKYCISNGEGLRTAVFFSGCKFHCKNCHNSTIWDFNIGKEYNDEIYQEIKESVNEHIAGLSILGGEPLVEENVQAVTELCKRFKIDFPDKTIWLWTGYNFDDIKNLEVCQYLDVIVDGLFIEEEKDINLKWRGSRNQNVYKLTKDKNYVKIDYKDIKGESL
jgi:anaerobic ribonucleoside-triphosphate reductase activating protein